MTDPELQIESMSGADKPYFGLQRLRRTTSRRLVVTISVTGILLLAFGLVAFWQVNDQYSLLEKQHNIQFHSTRVVVVLSTIGDLQRDIVRQSILIGRAHLNGRPASINDLYLVLATKKQAIQAQLAILNSLLVDEHDRQKYEQLQKAIATCIADTEHMVAAAVGENGQTAYLSWSDLVLVDKATIEKDITQWWSGTMPTLEAATKTTAVQIERVFLIARVVLIAGGIIVLSLSWMLARYIIKRDQVETHLRRTTELWKGTINSLKQGVAVFTHDRHLVLWNPRYPELNGVGANELRPGMHAEELIKKSVPRVGITVDDRVQRHVANMDKVRAGETVEREYVRVDGKRIQLGLHPMDSDYYFLTITDVTDMRHAEQLARDQAVRLGTIMNNVPDAIVTINTSGSIESWNAAAESMFGYKASEIIQRNVSVLMNEPHARQHDYYIRRYLNNGDKSTLGRLREFTARRQDGSEFSIDLRISEMELGEKRMFTGIIRDITERRAIEQMKSEFISTVSHELRTPLTSIMGALALLMDGAAGELPAKVQRLITMAEKNSQRLGRLINDILDLEKAEAGRMTLRLDVHPLLPLLRNSLEINVSYATRFNVELRLEADDADAVSVRVDEVRLLQVMSNLLSNAIKNSPPHAQVMVEVKRMNEVVQVTVHDAGPGIAEEFRERVFQRFAQADNSDSRRAPGTGLGLSITKQLVELHGGKIGFETGKSKVGSGSGASFWFELPVVTTTPLITAPFRVLNLNLVLCEDDPDVAEVLIEMLRLEGCRVQHAQRSSHVPALLNDKVSALLVDIDLPDQNGLSLVAELRCDFRWKTLPVLVVSGKRLTDGEQAAHESLHISAWLDKPVNRGALRDALLRIKPDIGLGEIS